MTQNPAEYVIRFSDSSRPSGPLNQRLSDCGILEFLEFPGGAHFRGAIRWGDGARAWVTCVAGYRHQGREQGSRRK